MTPQQELEQLKSALRLWANSKSYVEGCKRWNEVVRLMGEDVADPDRKLGYEVGSPEAEENAA